MGGERIGGKRIGDERMGLGVGVAEVQVHGPSESCPGPNAGLR